MVPGAEIGRKGAKEQYQEVIQHSPKRVSQVLQFKRTQPLEHVSKNLIAIHHTPVFERSEPVYNISILVWSTVFIHYEQYGSSRYEIPASKASIKGNSPKLQAGR